MRLNIDIQSNYEKLGQELRRGVLVLGVLSQLDEMRYGYALITRLSDLGLQVDQGTLYPLLRRLEDQGLLTSEWAIEGSRPRRYYQISLAGVELRSLLIQDWRALTEALNQMIQGID